MGLFDGLIKSAKDALNDSEITSALTDITSGFSQLKDETIGSLNDVKKGAQNTKDQVVAKTKRVSKIVDMKKK